jgi:hypothetical protein
VWRQSDGTRTNIWANRYVVGTGWGTSTLIETDNVGEANKPQVAMDDSGNAIAVWYQSDGFRLHIWTNRYVVGTGWGMATLIETVGSALDPQVAIDGSGNAIAVWRQYDGADYNIWAKRYVVGTGWGTATLIETDYGYAKDPQVAVDDSGNAIAVWDHEDGPLHTNIWANRYVVGTGWGTATLIETDDGDVGYPQVAMDGSGNAIAVWEQDNDSFGSRTSIYANRYVIGTGWGTATLIETDYGDASYPQVAMDGSGNAIAVWKQVDGVGRSYIWANRYVMPDTTPPVISLTNPIDDTITDVPTITVSGTTEFGVHLVVNGIVVDVASDGTFEFLLALSEGENIITAIAADASDNSATDTVTVTYVNPTPILEQDLQETKNELNATKDNLTETKNALETTQTELDDTKDDLTETKNALETTQAELDDTNDELAKAKEKLESQEMLILLVPLGVLVILIIILSILYMNLTKKIRGKGKPPSELPEETPPSEIDKVTAEKELEE